MRFSKALLSLVTMAAATVVLSSCCCVWGGRVSTGTGDSPRPSMTGSRTMVRRSYEVGDFRGVEAMSAIAVEIVSADTCEVTIETSENILPYVEIEVVNGVLTLGLRTGYTFNNFRLTAEVGMPALELVKLSGASRATLDGAWESERFEANLSGASNLKGDVSADEMVLSVSGSSRIVLDGAAARLEGEASGASTLDLGNFEAGTADINLSGSSRGTLDVTDALDAHLSGASRLEYGGSPTVTSNVSGGSTLRQR